jgi:hypothetical protein
VNKTTKEFCKIFALMATCAIILATFCAVTDNHASFGTWLGRWSSLYFLLFCYIAGLITLSKKFGVSARLHHEIRRARHYHLHDLLAGMAEENLHPEIGTGPAVGREFR